MTCWSVRNLLDLYADGRLTQARMKQTRAHLDSCKDCAAAVPMKITVSPVSAPEGLAEAIKAGLRARKGAEPLWDVKLTPAHAAAFACLAVLALAPNFHGAPSQAGRAELAEELLP